MAFGGGGAGIRSDINITPLVDVVLVLLIIFMVMTPQLLKEVELTVPDKADVEVATPTVADQVVVSVAKNGTISLNQEPITPEALIERMHDVMAARSEKLVFFDLDDEANYGDIVHVMDICRGAGAKTLGIMTKQ
jgi:biopolymer transport protein TolR